MDRYRATMVLPFVHLHEATALLRGTLSRRILDDGMPVPDWSTFRVVGPVEVFDPRGRIAYEYRGSVEVRRPRPLPNRRARNADA